MPSNEFSLIICELFIGLKPNLAVNYERVCVFHCVAAQSQQQWARRAAGVAFVVETSILINF